MVNTPFDNWDFFFFNVFVNNNECKYDILRLVGNWNCLQRNGTSTSVEWLETNYNHGELSLVYSVCNIRYDNWSQHQNSMAPPEPQDVIILKFSL